jgi:GntR family transcriptional regulator
VSILVDPTRATPPSRQIVEAVLDRIAGGDWGSGDRLPSVRGLAAEALVNPNTVGKAYRELEALRVVAGRNGAGVFVTPQGPGVARKQRRAATLAVLQIAVESALRSGHDGEELLRRIEQQIRATEASESAQRRRAS